MSLGNVFRAGNTLDDLKSVPQYPATSGWTLKLRLAPRTAGTVITLTAVAEGADFRVQATATTTAAWAAGWYTFEYFVENAGGEVYTVEVGQLQILAPLAAGQDNRSHVEKVLAAIEAVLEGRASTDQEEMRISVAGDWRMIKRTPIPELIKLKNLYAGYLRNEQAASNLAAGITGGGRRVQVVLR
jgi:hypothetical protein